ncbi:MAG: amidohydrolase family protein [Pseudomonadota bacterium]|nr:amidohydrolase family protein [Pseudomonadota bacterium]
MVGAQPYVFTSARPQPRSQLKKPEAFTIDIHCHVHIPEAAEIAEPHFTPDMEPAILFANEMTRDINMKQNVDRTPHLTTVDHRLIDMDNMGIDLQTIIPPPFQAYYWLAPEIGIKASEIINNGLAEIVNDIPDRFVAFGNIPLQDVDMAIAELERGVNKLGLKGFQILTNVNGSEISNSRLDPFWAKAQALDTLIFIHPNGFTSAERFKDHYFNNVIGNPLETTIAVHRLIFDGIMDRYPGLRILLAHGGGYLPAYSGRIDHVWGARDDGRIKINKPPTSYLKKMWLDTVVFTPHQLKYLIEQYGADKVVMGTDYPYDMGDYNPVELVDLVETLGSDDKAAIWGGNAKKLLKLQD